MAKKFLRKNEFRKHKKEPHPKYIFERKNDKYSYLSMTHKPPNNMENNYISLSHSANPLDNRKVYISKKVESDNMKNFGSRKKGWFFVEGDKKIVSKIIKKNKKGK